MLQEIEEADIVRIEKFACLGVAHRSAQRRQPFFILSQIDNLWSNVGAARNRRGVPQLLGCTLHRVGETLIGALLKQNFKGRPGPAPSSEIFGG